jgi:hypothetical protein
MDKAEAEAYERAARIIAQHDSLEGAEARADYLESIGWTRPQITYSRKLLARQEEDTSRPSPHGVPSSRPTGKKIRRGGQDRRRPPRNPRVVLSARSRQPGSITITIWLN